LLVGLLGTVIGGILYMRRRTDGLYGDVQGAINDFFDPKDAETPSLFMQTVDAVGQTIGNRIATQVEARVMASRSHEAKAENLLAEDLVTDIASQENPLLGMALDSLPAVRKRLAKNPTALSVLLPMLAKLGKSQAGSHNSGAPGDVAKRIKGGS
ncbi:unnamed protein product, partial [marine sediment metagenome]